MLLTRHQVLVSGRLLHIHVVHRALASPLDVVVCYQETVPMEAPDPDVSASMEARLAVWQQLDKLVSASPKRHSLIMMGDYNTHLPSSPSILVSRDPCGHISADADELIALCHRHDLVQGTLTAGYRQRNL